MTKLCEVSSGGTVTKTTNDCTASGTGATTLALAWNALDHLLTATRTGTGAVTESYAYDDSGRRITKVGAGGTAHYLYNGDDIHAEWSGSTISGMPAAVYAHGANIDEPLLRLTGATNGPSATQAAYMQDGLGSVVGTTNITGTLTANQRFDAWGVKTASSGTIPQYGYTGREPDATGLTFYRARYYHPGIGRFASRDPAGMADAVSPYAYVGNNPINLIDPWGLAAASPQSIQLAQANTSYFGKAVSNVLPEGAPIVTIGNAIGGVAAYLTGKATGDQSLADAASQGLAETKGANLDALLLLGTVGRGGTKTFQTYTRTNPTTGEVYSGRTSGTGTPEQNVINRNRNSPLNNKGFDDPIPDRSSSNPAAIRGREQQLIEQFGGAKSQGGTSANKINGVSPANQNRQRYLDDATREFGTLPRP
jgi:RHS repeat-associated protein